MALSIFLCLQLFTFSLDFPQHHLTIQLPTWHIPWRLQKQSELDISKMELSICPTPELPLLLSLLRKCYFTHSIWVKLEVTAHFFHSFSPPISASAATPVQTNISKPQHTLSSLCSYLCPLQSFSGSPTMLRKKRLIPTKYKIFSEQLLGDHEVTLCSYSMSLQVIAFHPHSLKHTIVWCLCNKISSLMTNVYLCVLKFFEFQHQQIYPS